MIGAGTILFFGFGYLISDYEYRNEINLMKGHAFTLLMLRQEKNDVAKNFLIDTIKHDQERLKIISTIKLSKETTQQLDMLNSIYEQLEEANVVPL